MSRVSDTYYGSDGEATRRLYRDLEALGPVGFVAMNLFRASKASERAKVYRGGNAKGSYRRQSYDKKQWSLDQLTAALTDHGAALSITFGWAVDLKAVNFENVLYVDLPTGQVSFHSAHRGRGPDYSKAWDSADKSANRIIKFCQNLLPTNEERAA